MKIISCKKYIVLGFILIFCIGAFSFNIGFFRNKANKEAAMLENRTMAEFPKGKGLLKKKSFYKDFENWYRDRMLGRRRAILYWRKANYAIGVLKNKNLIETKDGWILPKSMPQKYIDDKQKIEQLKMMQEFCKKNNSKFLVMIAPYRDNACKQYYPYKYREKIVDFLEISNQAADSLKQNNISYLDTCPTIMKAMENDSDEYPLYIKDDHHWSCFGAMVASDLLLKKLEKELKCDLYDKELTDGTLVKAYRERSRWTALGLGDDPDRYIQKIPWHKKFTNNLELIDCYNNKKVVPDRPITNEHLWGRIVNGEGIIHNKDLHNGKTLLMLHDSYGSYMMPYLSQYFETIISTHYTVNSGQKKNTNMKYLLERYKPNIVVLFPIGYPYADVNSIFKNVVYK